MAESFDDGFLNFDIACRRSSAASRRAMANFCVGTHDSELEPIAPPQSVESHSYCWSHCWHSDTRFWLGAWAWLRADLCGCADAAVWVACQCGTPRNFH